MCVVLPLQERVLAKGVSASLGEIADDYNDHGGDNDRDATEYGDYDQDGLITRPQGDGDMRP